ncbi:MAG: helix-hairpin-helix domain-containing protein [Demequinaceae bacterium]|nr:helix-hairpin-helix domain-containing protein [Demequinaceae bacterium]
MDDAEDVRTRWRDGLTHLASRAYRAASATPVPDERGLRWRIDPRPAFAIGVVLVFALVAAWLILRPDSHPMPTVRVVERDVPRVVVHVTGAVESPGVMTLEGGSRVVDAVEAAGGLTPEADQSAINLARIVGDGEQIYVPLLGEGGQGRVNLNRATSAELEGLPGIGPVLAERIVADRNENGPFTALDDLSRVPGIGDAMISEIASMASV